MCQSLSIAREGLEPLQNYSSFFLTYFTSDVLVYVIRVESGSESEGVRKFGPLVTDFGYLKIQAGTSTWFRSTVNENEVENSSSKSGM